MRVLIAPDCYGDTLTAVEAARAIADGWHRGRPDDELTLAPQSDGGPGFVGVLAGRLGEVHSLRVHGPLTAQVSADWVLDPATPITAYIECAQACGLALLGGPPTVQTALAAHSRGVGQLIAAAVRASAARIVVGLGGSSCTDGGRGMVADLGGLAAGRKLLADVELIAATRTKTGLKVECVLDTRVYEKGIKVSKAAMKALDIRGDEFHPEWNYSVVPRMPKS